MHSKQLYRYHFLTEDETQLIYVIDDCIFSAINVCTALHGPCLYRGRNSPDSKPLKVLDDETKEKRNIPFQGEIL